jgi:diguanylate cyclase (GGDEF)-like protein
VDRSRSIAEGVADQLESARAFRGAILQAISVSRVADLAGQRAAIAADIVELIDADAVRIYGATESGELALLPGQDTVAVPADARAMELELASRAPAAHKSLISSHPSLDPALEPLRRRCAAQQLITHVLVVDVDGDLHGAFAAHWISHERPAGARRHAFYYYWDIARVALAACSERERIERRLAELHEHAYVDQLTGLPSGLALDEQLRAHERDKTEPLSILVLDFDGMREANTAFGYEGGGDVLIRAVGQALARLTCAPEFAARLHRGGDEFAVILPGVDGTSAAVRAQQVEAALDALRVPETHQALYHGASVGAATLGPDEGPGQTLGRAIAAMAQRKRVRKAR